MAISPPRAAPTADELETLASIQRRVLWLATRMIDYANHERPSDDQLKVGGHQASSASMVTAMTALYFHWLKAGDRVAVKPHASPVLHSINYLLGRLDREYLTQLRGFGGLQAYPSRTKDPDPIDFSTGSVGLGAAAPLFASVVDRYVSAHFDVEPGSRFVALLGDAELDEGNIWEALADPAARGLGQLTWIVDFNRQSLDRVIPGVRSQEFTHVFRDHGWQVEIVKYGTRLREAFARDGGESLERRIDAMPNPEYQSLLRKSGADIRKLVVDNAPAGERKALAGVLEAYEDAALPALIGDLGGHDLGDMIAALERADADPERPTVIFAFTVKGWGLPIAGHPMNHSALLTTPQVDELRGELADPTDEWASFAPATAEGRLCLASAERLSERHAAPARRVDPYAIPNEFGPVMSRTTSSQDAFARVLQDIANVEEVARNLVTTSPDVSISTGLGGWINKRGVFSPEVEEVFEIEDAGPLKWEPSPKGQHIELGISEMNLFLLLGQLGLSAELHGQQLLPVGTVYDPFVCRGLDALIYSVYSGARFVFAGTPSGISLSREGGAHQSSITASIGMELPGLTMWEPCYALETEWAMLHGLRDIVLPDGEAHYLRLSTTPVAQDPFVALLERSDRAALRDDVLAGGYRLAEAEVGGPDSRVVIAACGAMIPQALAARELLAAEDIGASIVNVTSPDRLFRALRTRTNTLRSGRLSDPSILERLVLPEERGVPLVTVHDAAPHALSFLGSAFAAPLIPLGVDRFGQCGSQPEVYEWYDLSAEAIAEAAIAGLWRPDA
jgi:pyruvate dehydrogenase E1 component